MMRIRVVEKMADGASSINGLVYLGSKYRVYRVVLEEPQEVVTHNDKGMTISVEWKPVEVIWDLTNREE